MRVTNPRMIVCRRCKRRQGHRGRGLCGACISVFYRALRAKDEPRLIPRDAFRNDAARQQRIERYVELVEQRKPLR